MNKDRQEAMLHLDDTITRQETQAMIKKRDAAMNKLWLLILTIALVNGYLLLYSFVLFFAT